MLITLTEYRGIFTDKSGNDLPMAGGVITTQSLTAAGAFAALHADTQIVRFATDTAVKSDIEIAAGESLHPVGAENFAATAGRVITVSEL